MEHLNKASAHKALLQALRMDRFKGALQIECVYVSPEHRGKGLLKPILDQVIRSTQVPSGTAQLMVDGSNEAALRAYEKLGFKVDRRIMADETLNQGILPSATRCSMILDI
jgi:ribosomal protein S18 acetylase RimI-like enzyme